MKKIHINTQLFLYALTIVLVLYGADSVLAQTKLDEIPNPWSIVSKIASENLAALLTGVCLATWFVYSKDGIGNRIKEVEHGTIANNKLLLAIAKKLDINSLD